MSKISFWSSSRSSDTPRFSNASKSSFSSTRTREYRTPTLALLTPVFLFLRSQRERQRLERGDLELSAASRALRDLVLHHLGEVDVGKTFGALRGARCGLDRHYCSSCWPV